MSFKLKFGTPRVGLAFRYGPLRAFFPILASKPAKRTQTTQLVKVFTHAGCAVQHRSEATAIACDDALLYAHEMGDHGIAGHTTREAS